MEARQIHQTPLHLSPHPARWPFTLEKWYVDVLTPDGSVLLLYLALVSILGIRIARVTADFYLRDGQVVHGDAIARGVAGGVGTLTFGPATIDGDRVAFQTSGLAGELRYHSRFPPCALRAPFLTDGSRSLTWNVEVPDADVEGWLDWFGRRVELVGRGYRDRVWFDLLPWRFPIRTLEWGRAVSATHAATWVRARTAPDTIAASWVDGAVRASGTIQVPPGEINLGPSEVFLDTDVAGIEGIRPAGLRRVLAWLGGNPHETKWRAPCAIAFEPGFAVHEVARWKR